MQHPRKQLLFAVLSVADLTLTCWLLARFGGRVYEANPLARWWLESFGFAGLAGFKAAAVVAVLGLVLLIARSRPRAAGTVLALGCAITTAVVLYSVALLHLVPRTPVESYADAEKAINRKAQQAFLRHARFYHGLRRKVPGLIAGRHSLREVAEWVEASERGRDPGWRQSLQALHPERPIDEAFARCVIAHAVNWAAETSPRSAQSVARQLNHELQLSYGGTCRSSDGARRLAEAVEE